MSIEVSKKRGVRYYKDEDKATGDLPSVTSILNLIPKPRLQKWALKQTIDFLVRHKILNPQIIAKAYGYHSKLLDSLATKGTNRHKQLCDYLEGKEVTHDKWLKRFIVWEEENDFKVVSMEVSILDKYLGFAGTMDLIGTVHGEPIIIDLKTSSAIRFSHKVQLCAYKLLLGCIGYKLGVLDIPRDASKPKWYILTEPEEEEYTKLFLSCYDLFKQLNAVGELEL